MNDSDLELLNGFLDQLGEIMGTAGCNDFQIPDTPHNRDLFMCAYGGDVSARMHVKDGQILCEDFMILHELQRRLRDGAKS